MASPGEWEAFVGEARERIAARKARLDEAGFPSPGADATFDERYDHLLRELGELLEELPEIDVEAHGTTGLRMRFEPSEREVRITRLEEQGLVHFVFGHATLGTLHRAEHHASRPFGDKPPDVPRLLRQLLNFLIEGVEPRWLTERPSEDGQAVRESPGQELELPLD